MLRSPLVEIGWGFVIGFVAFVGLRLGVACTSSGQLTPLLACKLGALKILPDDPGNATVYDAVDIIERIRACHRLTPDGGAP